MGDMFGAVLSIDMQVLGAKIAQEQLKNIRIAIETIGRSINQVNKQFLGLTQQQLSGWGRTLGSLKSYNNENLRAIEINQSNAAALKKLFGESEKVKKSLATFDMRMLSILFGGMALQRAFGGALKSMFDTFNKAENNTNALSEATTGLSASWEFLKFSIINALSQSEWFMSMINFLIKAIRWVSDFINKFPELGTAIVTAFGVLAATGTVMMIIAQFSLLWNATFGIGGVLAKQTAAGMGTAAAEAGTATGAVSSGFMAMKNIVAGGLLIYGIFKVVKSLLNPSEITGKDAILAGLSTGLGVGLLTASAPAGFIAAAAVLITLVYASENAKVQERINEAYAKSPELRDPMEAYITGYSGTGIPMDVQYQTFQKSIGLVGTEAENLNKILEYGYTKVLPNYGEKIDEVDYAIEGGSLRPSMNLLNKEFFQNITHTDLLIEKYPNLTIQAENHTTSIERQANAYEHLAEARRKAFSALNSNEETNADGASG